MKKKFYLYKPDCLKVLSLGALGIGKGYQDKINLFGTELNSCIYKLNRQEHLIKPSNLDKKYVQQ